MAQRELVHEPGHACHAPQTFADSLTHIQQIVGIEAKNSSALIAHCHKSDKIHIAHVRAVNRAMVVPRTPQEESKARIFDPLLI